MARLCFIAVALVLTAPLARPAEPPGTWVGKTVVPKSRVELRVGNKSLGHPGSLEMYVEKEQAEWLWISSTTGKSGWVRKTEVLTFDQAIPYFTDLIGREPKNASPHRTLAWVYKRQRDYDHALEHATAAIRLDPDNGPYTTRAFIWSYKGQYQNAHGDFQKALRKNETAMTFNNFAWFLATCPDAMARDGKRAVELSRKACDLTKWSHPGHLDTLAAAYAECGDFKSAVKWQQEAVDRVPNKIKPTFLKRLEDYMRGRPYREESAD